METLEVTKIAPEPRVLDKKLPIQKICFILSKSQMDSAYAAMVMANGARMEGIEVELFFTFFGLDVINKSKMNHLHFATVGNPSMPIPTIFGGLPGMESLVSSMMKKQMEELDLPPVDEFMEMIHLSGAKIWACKLAVDMFKLQKTDMVDYLDGVLTIGDFYARAAGEGTHIVFI
jgi:peroxiredoxin family protein